MPQFSTKVEKEWLEKRLTEIILKLIIKDSVNISNIP